MKNNKKFGLFLSLAMLLGLVACGPTSEPTSTPTEDPTTSEPTTAPSVDPTTDPTSDPTSEAPSFVPAEYISIVTESTDWSTDIDFTTTDGGYTWKLSDQYFEKGEFFKVRENHAWKKKWGINDVKTTNTTLKHHSEASNDNIGIEIEGYYSITLDYINNALTVNLDREIITNTHALQVKDIKGNNIGEAEVYVNGTLAGKTDTTGAIDISYKGSDATILLKKDGYSDCKVNVNSTSGAVIDVTLPFKEAKIGSLVSKTWPKYEAFTSYVTRSSDAFLIKHVANNEIFTSEGRNSLLETYISVGDTTSRDGNEGVTQIVVKSDKTLLVNNYGGKDIGGVKSEVIVESGKTTVLLAVPFASLGVAKDAIIGTAVGLYSNVDSDWAPMHALETTTLAAVETPSAYVRSDIDNKVFTSPINDYPPAVSYDKEELIKGRPYNVGNPTETKMAAADDIYFSVKAGATGFEFDMVGFGDFQDSEYIKFIFHTSEVDGGGWQTQASDLQVLVSKSQAKYRTGLTDFWGYTNFGNDMSADNQPTYSLKDEGYFTLNWTLNYTEIPEYDAKGEVSFIAIEFGNGVIYNNDPWTYAMMKNGMPVGDPANQAVYPVIQEKDTGVNKDEILKDFNIKFSHTMYAKFNRSADGLKLTLLSFSSLKDSDYIRFVVDTDGQPVSGGWALNKDDVSFTIYKDKSYIETGKTGFWDGEAQHFHGSNFETLNTVSYNENESYWTIELLIDWGELGNNINETSPLKGLLLLFNPSIQNAGFSYDGKENVGDQALQQNYFTI